MVFVDKGYREAEVLGAKVWRSGLRRGAIKPMIGHMKNEGLLRRNWLRGSLGNALHALLCGAGHNLRMNLQKLWLLHARILAFLGTLSAILVTAKTPTHAAPIRRVTDYLGPTN